MPPVFDSTSFRRLWQSDSQDFRGHMLRLPAESRHNRFGMGVSDDFVERYTERNIGIENVIYGFFADGVLRAVGELRPMNPQRLLGIGGEMEAAFSVEPEWRKLGIGSQLMQLVIRAARTRCCTTLYLSFLSGNVPMRRLALKYGAEIETDCSESEAHIHPDLPTPMAIWDKTFDDARSFAIAALDFQRQRLQQSWQTDTGRYNNMRKSS